MRITGRVADLSIVSCILCFVACSSDDDAAPSGDDGSSGNSSSGKSSSSGQNASSGASGSTSSGGPGDAGEDPDADKPVPVGDGSLGAGCNKDDECNSKVCAVGHKCVIAPSCRPSKNGATPGIDTCGKAEPGDESCCTTLTMPKTTTRTLDKFEITSGRIRAFIESLPSHNVQKFAKDYAAAHPNSELGKLATEFPGYLDALTDGKQGTDTPLAVWLGAFPQDAINRYDGCYVQPGISGAATYWQDPSILKPYDIGYGNDPEKLDGTRKYPASILDTKPANCMPPVLLATFCAWDGGELARTSDYYEVWGHTQEPVAPGGALFTRPWTTVVSYGEWNWMNGHGTGCPIAGWPGCDPNSKDDDKVPFFSFPKGSTPSDDDSPEIGAPGRFPKDVTAAKSGDGASWMDIGGNLLEAAWPNNGTLFQTTTQNFCNTMAPADPGDPSFCNRDQPAVPDQGIPAEARPGSLLFKGQPPTVALIGASFEGHIGYGEAYFAAQAEDESKLKGYGVPAHFQYGKVGGRCARTK